MSRTQNSHVEGSAIYIRMKYGLKVVTRKQGNIWTITFPTGTGIASIDVVGNANAYSVLNAISATMRAKCTLPLCSVCNKVYTEENDTMCFDCKKEKVGTLLSEEIK